ncbi:ATP-binding cassette domain-containing protein [Xenorhabdus nematophila]|nr:ATP-binding cassette domain-containing protein [Xenorhabdus nematophila]
MFLTTGQQALVGRNGIGKSCLAAILAGKMMPSEGYVHRFCDVGYLSQKEAQLPGTGADVLGINIIRQVNERILIGKGTPDDFNFMEGQWNWESETKVFLEEGGLSSDVLDRAFVSLSGGEQTRLRLLALKKQGYDFIVLDEPSNHLDRNGRIWLAQWLSAFNGGSLLVTHDTYLLEKVSSIYELNSIGIEHSQGGWQSWLESREQLRLGIQRETELSKKYLQQVQRDKQKMREKAEKRQNQGKSRRSNANQSKIILDREQGRSEATQSRNAKLYDERIQRAAVNAMQAKDKLEIIEPLVIVASMPERATNPLLYLRNVVLPFGTLTPVNLVLNSGERLAILGDNGSGKSTLLKVMAGLIKPVTGECTVTRSHRLMDQHFSFLDKELSALQNFQHQAPGWTENLYRTRLAQLRIHSDIVLKPVSTLSGGEQLKIALACLFCGPSAPSLLILDEPDNHLDIESRELLQQALRNYKGAILLVSHDIKFIEKIGDMNYLCLNL